MRLWTDTPNSPQIQASLLQIPEFLGQVYSCKQCKEIRKLAVTEFINMMMEPLKVVYIVSSANAQLHKTTSQQWVTIFEMSA